jgi:hypothetical protein
MAEAMHTTLPWSVGAQNDILYITAGHEPSMNNDYPWHDAKRVVVARIYDAHDGSAAVHEGPANAAHIVECVNGREALEAAKQEAEDRYLRAQDDLMKAREANEALVEALTPFARADRAIGAEPGPFRFETGAGHRLIEREDLRHASAALARGKA